MTLKSSFLFAYRMIFSRDRKKTSARRSIIGSIICIAISIVPMVIVLSVSDGMISGMTQRIIGLSTGDLECFVSRKSQAAKSEEDFTLFASAFNKVPGVTGSFCQIEGDALVAGKNYRTGARIRCVPPDIFRTNSDFKNLFTVQDGSTQDFENDLSAIKKAVIGSKMAELLSLKAGDTFRLITAWQKENKMVVPKVSVFRVSAIISSGYQELDSLWVFIPLKNGFYALPKESSNFSVMIKTNETFSSGLETILQDCENAINQKALIYSWKDLNRTQFENFSSTKVLLLFVMALIVLVAAVNISSAIVMLVMERQKEIAILKSTGATSKGIAVSFLITGFLCGLSGIILGLPVGFLLSVNVNEIIFLIEKVVNFFAKMAYIAGGGTSSSFSLVHLLNPDYYLTQIPVVFPIKELFAICVFVLVLSVCVSFIPAVKAGKQRPLEIFKKS